MSQETQRDKMKRQSGVRLPLEAGMRLSLSLGGLKESDDADRLNCELVGVVHFEYLILRLPWVPGLRTRLIPGGLATIRLVSDGQLSGFQAEILTHVAKPSLLLFLSYPEVVETLSLRLHQRVSCALPVHVHARRGDGYGLIVDLSQGGCRLVLDVRGNAGLRQMTAGDEVLMRATLDTEAPPVPVSSKVRSVNLETTRIFFGVAFAYADAGAAAFSKALEKYLELAALLL